MIIGIKRTPVRTRGGSRGGNGQPAETLLLHGGGSAKKTWSGFSPALPESAWDQASELSRQVHMSFTRTSRFTRFLSCAPPMYDELWTAGKCMYKLEPVLADDGELIIYAPHLKEICISHGAHINQVGYHCRDYFLRQWDKFKDIPWGVLAHSTHVRGASDVRKRRRKVPGHRHFGVANSRGSVPPDQSWLPGSRQSINPETFANREAEGILLVPKAGEMLYQLKHPPKLGWRKRILTTVVVKVFRQTGVAINGLVNGNVQGPACRLGRFDFNAGCGSRPGFIEHQSQRRGHRDRRGPFRRDSCGAFRPGHRSRHPGIRPRIRPDTVRLHHRVCSWARAFSLPFASRALS
jgi:hypothetical protein